MSKLLLAVDTVRDTSVDKSSPGLLTVSGSNICTSDQNRKKPTWQYYVINHYRPVIWKQLLGFREFCLRTIGMFKNYVQELYSKSNILAKYFGYYAQ